MLLGDAEPRHAVSECPWDFTALADTYDFRPDYNAELIRDVLRGLQSLPGDRAIDIGAGTGKLTAHLCANGLDVIAVEPNPRMRARGVANPAARNARWTAARGEALPIRAGTAAIVSFGSSFNVVEPRVALDECARVLIPRGAWFAVYNHRDLEDPLQREVEAIIHHHVPGFDYGRRRRSPEADVVGHGAFCGFESNARRFVAQVDSAEWMLAWNSHATLQRQAGSALPAVLRDIHRAIGDASVLAIPYVTCGWSARRRP